jgi:hypothetical protein
MTWVVRGQPTTAPALLSYPTCRQVCVALVLHDAAAHPVRESSLSESDPGISLGHSPQEPLDWSTRPAARQQAPYMLYVTQ